MAFVKEAARGNNRAPQFLYFFGIALAAGAGFRVAGTAHLDFGQSAVATVIIVLASGYVAGNVYVYVVVHIKPPNLFWAVRLQIIPLLLTNRRVCNKIDKRSLL